jgi:hypothetical protein
MWLTTAHIQCKHGFSTRQGGISPAPFNSLNLAGSQDDPVNIEKNKTIALASLNLEPNNLCFLKQVHGVSVCDATAGWQEGDALVTNNKKVVLVISVADCYPILFYDQQNAVIAAAHAGWRGTVGGIVTNTIIAMQEKGAKAEQIRIVIGPGISQERFEVGDEVLEQFRQNDFPEYCWVGNKIDLLKSNKHLLLRNNILEKNIFSFNRCTYESDFFSYRRDRGVTGRMWGLITLQ